MPLPNDVRNDMLIEAVTLDDNDVLIGYSARNQRSRGWRASTLNTYFAARLKVVAASINQTTNVITITHGDGTEVTGTVTS